MYRAMQKGHFRSLLYGLLASSLAFAATAVSADEKISFCYVDWPPYTELVDGVEEGITISIIRAAAQVIERDIEFVKSDWNDCLEKVKQGQYDAILDAAKRDAYLQGPTSFNSYVDTFWVANASNVSRYEQLRGGRVALVDGYNYDPRLIEHLQDLDAEVVHGADDPTIVRDLASGRYDAAVSDLASIFHFAREENLEIHPILPPFTEDRLYASFHKGRAEVQRDFDRAFAQLLEQGVVDQIYERHIGVTFSSFKSP